LGDGDGLFGGDRRALGIVPKEGGLNPQEGVVIFHHRSIGAQSQLQSVLQQGVEWIAARQIGFRKVTAEIFP